MDEFVEYPADAQAQGTLDLLKKLGGTIFTNGPGDAQAVPHPGLTPLKVPCDATGARLELNCWEDAKRYAEKRQGYVVVYGWALWAYRESGGGEVFVAQHHAVVCSNGAFLDVSSLGKSHKAITFAVDFRVPYDGIRFRAPASLYREADGSYAWCDLQQTDCLGTYVSVLAIA
jgi:hypothetical protein